MTNPATARKLVLLSVMGLLVIATYKGKGKVATSTRLWGTGWLAVMLGVAADVAPQVAGPFALLILAGALTGGGDKVFTDILAKAGTGTAGTGGNSHPAGPRGPIGKPSKPSGNSHPAGPHGPIGTPSGG